MTANISRLHNGVSVEQAKRDAKQLAKRNSISLSSAQNAIANNHRFDNWAALMHSIHSVSYKVGKFEFPQESSLTTLVGRVGSGKSFALASLALSLSTKRIPVIYLTCSSVYPDLSVESDVLFSHLSKVSKAVTVINVVGMPKDSLARLIVNNAVVMIDEGRAVFDLHYEAAMSLVLCAKYSFISLQSKSEYVTNANGERLNLNDQLQALKSCKTIFECDTSHLSTNEDSDEYLLASQVKELEYDLA